MTTFDQQPPAAILATSDGVTNRHVDTWAAGWYTARDCGVIVQLLDGTPWPVDPLHADAPGGPLAGSHLLRWDPVRHARFDVHGLRVVEGARYDGADRRFITDGSLIFAVTYPQMATPLRTLPPWFLTQVRAAAAQVAAVDAEGPADETRWWKTATGLAWLQRWHDVTDRSIDLATRAWRNCRPDSRERLMKRADHEPTDLLELLVAGGAA